MQGTLKLNAHKIENLERYLIQHFNLGSIEAEEIIIHVRALLQPRPKPIPWQDHYVRPQKIFSAPKEIVDRIYRLGPQHYPWPFFGP
jgi:hypothetical protein